MVKQPCLYGAKPYTAVVVHGGPGSSGEMGPVAEELATAVGVIEPFQSALSLNGQVEELRETIERLGSLPVILIGFSWGAWLSIITAARYLQLVKKLILISTPSFDPEGGKAVAQTRLERMTASEIEEVNRLEKILDQGSRAEKDAAIMQWAQILFKSECYDSIVEELNVTAHSEIYEAVWPQAAEMRRNGTLLALLSQIQCPVVATHGDYDPHSHEGVTKVLSTHLKRFQFLLIPRCGHYPWVERHARNLFFCALKAELA